MMFGRLTLNFLIELILPGTKLTVKTKSKDPLEIYVRTLAYVYLPNGRYINEILVSESHAKPFSLFHCSKYTNYQILNMKAKNEKKRLYRLLENF